MILYLIIIVIASTIVSVIFYVFAKKEMRIYKATCLSLIIAALVLMVLCAPASALYYQLVGDSKNVASLDKNGSKYIVYHDEQDDQYFVINGRPWDIKNMQYRVYLDAKEVESYLYHYNALKNINLFDEAEHANFLLQMSSKCDIFQAR